MKPLFQSVVNLKLDHELIKRRAYGVIEVVRGEFSQIQLKPYPKLGSIVEARWISQWRGKRRAADRCQLFYNQPMQHRNYLTLSYIESTFQTSWKSISRALRILDQVAFIKHSDAILTEVANDQISDRLMIRLGWEPHREGTGKRHFIKRFYGEYPSNLVTFKEETCSS